MNNPFSIIRLIIRATRPSRLSNMKAVKDAFWLGKNYEALTFFGFIVTHSEQEARHINSTYDALKNHEMIHLRQAQDCHDSWFLFYLRYLWYWLRALPASHYVWNVAYHSIPFELEAYRHMYDLHYLDDKRSGTSGWREYAKMSIKERLHKNN